MLVVQRLVWDDWNIAHIARHDVVPDDVEAVCHNDPIVSATYNDRLRVIGATHGGAILTVILAPEGEGAYYVITARPASRKERRLYQSQERGETS
jgi:uncharacterized DUF497 family protein